MRRLVAEDGLGSCESVGEGKPWALIAPTERLKKRRQMAAAAGKKESVSLSLCVEGD